MQQFLIIILRLASSWHEMSRDLENCLLYDNTVFVIYQARMILVLNAQSHY